MPHSCARATRPRSPSGTLAGSSRGTAAADAALPAAVLSWSGAQPAKPTAPTRRQYQTVRRILFQHRGEGGGHGPAEDGAVLQIGTGLEIGRASCRERV